MLSRSPASSTKASSARSISQTMARLPPGPTISRPASCVILPPPVMNNFDAAVEIAKTILKGQIARAAQIVIDRAIVRKAIGRIPKGYPVLELPISCETGVSPSALTTGISPTRPSCSSSRSAQANGVQQACRPRPTAATCLRRSIAGSEDWTEAALAASGHPEAIFVHRNLFFAISRTREATMALINEAIAAQKRAA